VDAQCDKLATELSWQRLRWSTFWVIASYLSKVANFNLLTSIWRLRWGWPLLSFAAIFGVGKLEFVQGYCVALFRAELRPNLAWAWCCYQKRPYFLLGIQDRPSPITCEETTLYWIRLHVRIYSSMVPFEIDIKLSAINSKVLNVVITRKETRRPCCRSEPRRDVGHLYGKLAPDPLVTQWTERTLKLSKTRGSCRQTTFQVYQWRTDGCRRMVSRDLEIKVHEIRGISFHWPHL